MKSMFRLDSCSDGPIKNSGAENNSNRHKEDESRMITGLNSRKFLAMIRSTYNLTFSNYDEAI